jgi:hypothetical protein
MVVEARTTFDLAPDFPLVCSHSTALPARGTHGKKRRSVVCRDERGCSHIPTTDRRPGERETAAASGLQMGGVFLLILAQTQISGALRIWTLLDGCEGGVCAA